MMEALLSAPADSHYFQWDGVDSPFTDDPRYAGRLEYGPHNRALCDGVDVGAATRFQTGPNGWVEFHVLDANGKTQIVGDQIIKEIRRGNVQYVDLRDA